MNLQKCYFRKEVGGGFNTCPNVLEHFLNEHFFRILQCCLQKRFLYLVKMSWGVGVLFRGLTKDLEHFLGFMHVGFLYQTITGYLKLLEHGKSDPRTK